MIIILGRAGRIEAKNPLIILIGFHRMFFTEEIIAQGFVSKISIFHSFDK
jgi:hypothetical protein